MKEGKWWTEMDKMEKWRRDVEERLGRADDKHDGL